jgi:hypothetical protein
MVCVVTAGFVAPGVYAALGSAPGGPAEEGLGEVVTAVACVAAVLGCVAAVVGCVTTDACCVVTDVHAAGKSATER